MGSEQAMRSSTQNKPGCFSKTLFQLLKFRLVKKTTVYKKRVATKVSNFDMKVVVQQEVFWFQIPMYDHVPVAIVHSRYNLLEKPASLILLQLKEKKLNIY